MSQKLRFYPPLKILTAKSTRCSFPTLTLCFPSGPLSLHSIVTVKIAWDRELVAFMLVAPTTPKLEEKKTNKLFVLCYLSDKKNQIITGVKLNSGFPGIWNQIIIQYILSRASEAGSPTNRPGSDKTQGQGSFGPSTGGLFSNYG